MMGSRAHPFNRSTRPLLERNDDTTTTTTYPSYRPYGTSSAAAGTVSAPNAPQILRGFHDFDYVPKTSFYGGYPYGSPPSPGARLAAAHQSASPHFAFSDDSGVHTIHSHSNNSSSSRSNSSSHSSPNSSVNFPAASRQLQAPPPPPPPPKRYYVDDTYEDDDGYSGAQWRPYGGHIAATKGPFVFGMMDTSGAATAAATAVATTTVISNAGHSNSKVKCKAPKTKKKQKLKLKQQQQQQQLQQWQQDENYEPPAEDLPAARSIKCVVVGDAAVGKTNLICSYLENRFVGEHIPTASDEFNFEVTVNESPVRVTLCDTAGQDTLDALRQLSYPDSDVFVLCFSVVRPDTFRSLQRKWLPQFRRRSPTALVLLVGTQADLRTDPAVLGALQRGGEAPVTVTAACAVAQAVGGQYVETSSRYRVGVKDAFDAAIWQALLMAEAKAVGGKRSKRRGSGVPRPLWKRMLCWA